PWRGRRGAAPWCRAGGVLWARCLAWLHPLPVGLAQIGDGVAHLLVGAAAADVAAQGLFDLGLRGVGVLVEGGPHGDDEAGRAEAALLGVVVDEGGRHGVELAVGDEALGRLDRFTLSFDGKGGAGVDRLAVEHDGAGPAGAAVADALAAGDVEVVAEG